MKNVTMRSRKGLQFSKAIRAKTRGSMAKISYTCPVNDSDYKRWGRELVIGSDTYSVRLNGKAINSLKKLLLKVDEIYSI